MVMDRILPVETRQRTLSTTGPIPPLKISLTSEKDYKNSRRCQTSLAKTDYKVAQVPEKTNSNIPQLNSRASDYTKAQDLRENKPSQVG